MQNIVPSPRPGPHPAAGLAGGQPRGEGQRSLALRFQLWAGLLLLGHFDRRTFNPFKPAFPLGKASFSEGGKLEREIGCTPIKRDQTVFLGTSLEKKTYKREENRSIQPKQTKRSLKSFIIIIIF